MLAPTARPTPRHPDAPKKLGEGGVCPEQRRPCPWVGCRLHLLLNVGRDGKLSLNRPKKTPGRRRAVKATPDAQWFFDLWMEHAVDALWEMEYTCALDAAKEGGMTFERIAELFGWNKQNTHHEFGDAISALESAGVA